MSSGLPLNPLLAAANPALAIQLSQLNTVSLAGATPATALARPPVAAARPGAVSAIFKQQNCVSLLSSLLLHSAKVVAHNNEVDASRTLRKVDDAEAKLRQMLEGGGDKDKARDDDEDRRRRSPSPRRSPSRRRSPSPPRRRR